MLSIDGVSGARLVVDGRDAGCAVPCTIDLRPGDHVVAVTADGYLPASKQIRVPDSWLRGFLQVQSAATLPGTVLEIAPVDFYSILFTLRTRKAKKPRKLCTTLDFGCTP